MTWVLFKAFDYYLQVFVIVLERETERDRDRDRDRDRERESIGTTNTQGCINQRS